jgi:IS5 family transposase
VVPWQSLINLIELDCPLPTAHDPADPSVVAEVSPQSAGDGEALFEVPTMRLLAGIELISDRIPDETTILTFRYLVKKDGLREQILRTVKELLAASGVTMR